MVAVVLAAVLAAQQQPCGPAGPIFCGGLSRAFFEFAPADGAGMGAACACTTPTGAKGETMTFARASSATCLKTVGAAPQTIANGDMVTCTTDQLRVMPGTDGTSVNGILSETSKTNLAIRSEEFGNAAWTVANSGSVNPVVTADQGVAPDGTTTADRVQFSACAASTNASFILQTGRGTSGSNVGSVYCRGTSISQTISVCAFDDGANLGACTQIVCPATGWVRTSQLKTIAATTGGLVIGCNNASNYVGAASTGVADVLLWGAQYEAGTYASSYAKTVAASATRAADLTPRFSVSLANATFSMAATVVSTYNLLDSNHGILDTATAGPAYAQLLTYNESSSSEIRLYFIVGAAGQGANVFPNIATRFVGFFDGATRTVCQDGICSSTAGGSPSPTTLIEVGGYAGVAELNGVVKKVCVDPSPTRCR